MLYLQSTLKLYIQLDSSCTVHNLSNHFNKKNKVIYSYLLFKKCSETNWNTPNFSNPCSTIKVPAALYRLLNDIFPNGNMGLTVSGRDSSPYRFCHTMSAGSIKNRVEAPKAPVYSMICVLSIIVNDGSIGWVVVSNDSSCCWLNVLYVLYPAYITEKRTDGVSVSSATCHLVMLFSLGPKDWEDDEDGRAPTAS